MLRVGSLSTAHRQAHRSEKSGEGKTAELNTSEIINKPN